MPCPPPWGLPRKVCSAMRRGAPWGAMDASASFAADPRVKCGSPADEAPDGVDEEPGEPPDHGSVDPDELEIAADLQLDPAGRLGRVPAGHRRRDELADLFA